MLKNKLMTPKEPECRYIQFNRKIRSGSQDSKTSIVTARITGGVITPEQWLALDKLSKSCKSSTIKLTTRQELQILGVNEGKRNKIIKDLDLEENSSSFSDLINNVVCTSNQSKHHAEVFSLAKLLNDKLLSCSRDFHELPIDKQRNFSNSKFSLKSELDETFYTPYSFKIGFVIPPSNDIDVFSQDVGFIAIIRNKKLIGFNVTIGSGSEFSLKDQSTYSLLTKVIGFCKPEQIYDVCENLIFLHCDNLNSSKLSQIRFKDTVDKLGVRVIRNMLEDRLSWKFDEPKPFELEKNSDQHGCFEGLDGKLHITLYLENGKITEKKNKQLLTGLREIAKVHTGDFRLTASQNIILANITKQKRKEIIDLINKYNLAYGKKYTSLRRNSLACEGPPKCQFAKAEAESYFPYLLEKIEAIVDDNNLRNEDITIRMTGCPNGCARHTFAEIGFMGISPGKYNMYLGASYDGSRLNKMYFESLGEDEILLEMHYILSRFSKERNDDEHLGDFVIRKGIVK